MRHRLTLLVLAPFTLAVGGHWLAVQADDTPSKSPPPLTNSGAKGDADVVRKVMNQRKEYQQSLIDLYAHYSNVGDRERAKWAEEELKAHHLAWKPSYRLDIQDVPPATLEPRNNSPEANSLFQLAVEYKSKPATGNDYILNQRRAEILFQEILQKHPDSDKIADVAYNLGDLYEGRTNKQYDRAAAYYERAYQWRKGSSTDARLRAARLYDKMLNERSKAIELYRETLTADTDKSRIAEAERRLAELTGGRAP